MSGSFPYKKVRRCFLYVVKVIDFILYTNNHKDIYKMKTSSK